MGRWGGGVCGLDAPLAVFYASPLVHKNAHSIDLSKKIKLVNTTHKHDGGCIKHNLGYNKKLSKFNKDIVNPGTKSKEEDVLANDVLVNVVQPKLHCKPIVRARFDYRKKWTLPRLQALALNL